MLWSPIDVLILDLVQLSPPSHQLLLVPWLPWAMRNKKLIVSGAVKPWLSRFQLESTWNVMSAIKPKLSSCGTFRRGSPSRHDPWMYAGTPRRWWRIYTIQNLKKKKPTKKKQQRLSFLSSISIGYHWNISAVERKLTYGCFSYIARWVLVVFWGSMPNPNFLYTGSTTRTLVFKKAPGDWESKGFLGLCFSSEGMISEPICTRARRKGRPKPVGTHMYAIYFLYHIFFWYPRNLEKTRG